MKVSLLTDLLNEFPKLGQKHALTCFRTFRSFSYTYSDIFQKVMNVTGFLIKELGVAKGDRILLWGENSFEWIVSYWSCVVSGAEIVPIDSRLDIEFVKNIKNITQPRLIIGDNDKIDVLNSLDIPVISYQEINSCENHKNISLPALYPEDVFQIVFTSGTTSYPKGVIQKHTNVCSNLNPIFEELKKYKSYINFIGQIKILLLLPLTHMFGQSLGLFITPVLAGKLVLIKSLDMNLITKTIKREKINVIGCVPWFLMQFKNHLKRDLKISESITYLDILKTHRLLGFKFFAFVTGGAFLDESVENWWRKLKFLVIQGYGLTEASPIVAINHPLKGKPGSLGRGLKGQEIKISEDGEILIKGKNVCSGYLTSKGIKKIYHQWFPTGDLGYMDKNGKLYFKGRKKDVIVLPSGENIYPKDIEKTLKEIDGVKDCVVIGFQEKVHAVLLLEKEVNPEKIIYEANRSLNYHQQIKSWSIWPFEDFPRTSTFKIKKEDVIRYITDKVHNNLSIEPKKDIKQIISRIKNIPTNLISDHSRLKEDLFFSSIDYVELLCELEQNFDSRIIDELKLHEIKTVEDLKNFFNSQSKLEKKNNKKTIKNWRLLLPVRIFRYIWINLFLIPLFKLFIKINKVQFTINEPVIICANHTSHVDIIAIMMSLPVKVRNRIVPLVTSHPFRRFLNRDKNRIKRTWDFIKYILLGILFNGIPISTDPEGLKESLRQVGELLDKNFYPLIFPEGMRTPDGIVKPFMPGVGFIAKRLDSKVLPVLIKGTNHVLPVGKWIPRTNKVYIKFFDPMEIKPGESVLSFLQRLESLYIS